MKAGLPVCFDHINRYGTSLCSGAVMLSSASHSLKSLPFAHIYCTALLISWVKRISADGSLSWYFTCHWKRACCQLAREMLQYQLFAARVTLWCTLGNVQFKGTKQGQTDKKRGVFTVTEVPGWDWSYQKWFKTVSCAELSVEFS